MARKETIISSVRGGKLSKQAKECLVAQINRCEGGRVMIEVSKFSSNRSLPQNSYQHVIYTILRDGLNDLGNDFTMPRVKEICKYKFLLVDEINESTGEIIGQRIKSTTELSKVETMEYIDKIIAWAMESFNIYLPSAGEELQIDFEN